MSRFTIAIISLAAAAAILIFGVLPAWNSVGVARLEIKKLISVNDELQVIAKTRDELTAQYNTIPASDLTRLSSILPQKLSSAQFLRDIEALTTRRGLFLKSLDFVKQPSPTLSAQIQVSSQRLYIPASVSLNVRGSYDSLRAFLADLEKMIRLTDISDISFTAQSSVPGSQVFEYALRGSIYFSH
ncbi:MAG: type 4a pilus biogenesis protein PilO [bacterium]|nr:type 4a pilus biogenesis protein PilO [bacterium]